MERPAIFFFFESWYNNFKVKPSHFKLGPLCHNMGDVIGSKHNNKKLDIAIKRGKNAVDNGMSLPDMSSE